MQMQNAKCRMQNVASVREGQCPSRNLHYPSVTNGRVKTLPYELNGQNAANLTVPVILSEAKNLRIGFL